ncbi:universal stress protein [Desulfogranum mediterraneum]|uniref:universal stress protein n=1 Tax=Desulfogranum mediterraneum TaxID=160661 RepID=UPI000417A24E|nr:universal stress protein [Desulfogranum mediterraneum]
MNVIAAVNGQLSAEVAARYGLHFARVHGLALSLLHILNPGDSIRAVEESMANIEELARGYQLASQRVILQGPPMETLRRYLQGNKGAMLFCSTRYRPRRNLYTLSFGQELLSQDLPVDLAVVRVVQPHSTLTTERILLPIKEGRLSVEKFTFFASMLKAYQASGEIYSVTVTSRKKKANLDLGTTRQLLQQIDDRLSHYRQLALHMDIPLRLKHAIAVNEVDQLLHHLSHGDFQLMIVGGERLSAYSSFIKAKPIDRLQRSTPVNTIAFYPREKGR